MRKRGVSIIALAAVAVLSFIQVAKADPGDLWDVNDGLVVTGSSAIRSGSSVNNMFGATEGGLDFGSTLFNDNFSGQYNYPVGTLHWVTWTTPSAVMLKSFELLAAHDGAPTYARSFKNFRLLSSSDAGSSWDVLYNSAVSIPYDGTGSLDLLADVPATTTSLFKAEFTQATDYDWASGPRVIELRGFSTGTGVTPEPVSSVLFLLGSGALALGKRIRRK